MTRRYTGTSHLFPSQRSLALVSATLALTTVLTTCNDDRNSTLRVAGGIDAAKGDFPGTVYVDLNGPGFGGGFQTIRNVGTVVDFGHPNFYALFVSLKDAFDGQGRYSQLRVFNSATLTLYLHDRSTMVKFPNLAIERDTGVLKGEGQRYPILFVGLQVYEDLNKNQSNNLRDIAASLDKSIFEHANLLVKGRDFRDANTSFAIMALPRSKFPPGYKAANIGVATKPRAPGEKLKMVGFGESPRLDNTPSNSSSNGFSLNSEVNIRPKNIANVVAGGDKSPLANFLKATPDVASQLWEAEGSALCGSNDDRNYDTGASIYDSEGNFIGMGVLSTSSSGAQPYKGAFDCNKHEAKDGVVLVVSPTQRHLDKFVLLLKKVTR